MTEPPHPNFPAGASNPFHGPGVPPHWSHYQYYNTYWRGRPFHGGRRGGRLLFFALGAGAAALYFKKREHCERNGWDGGYSNSNSGPSSSRYGQGDERGAYEQQYQQQCRSAHHHHSWGWPDEYRRMRQPVSPPPPQPAQPVVDPAQAPSAATVAAVASSGPSAPAPAPSQSHFTEDQWRSAWSFDNRTMSDMTDAGLDKVISALSQLKTHIASETAKARAHDVAWEAQRQSEKAQAQEKRNPDEKLV